MCTRVLLAALLLGLVACAAPPGSQAPASQGLPSDAPQAIAVSVMDFMIEPVDVEAVGPTVTITVTNDGPTPHNLTVRNVAGDVLIGTEDLSVGDVATISGELEAGDYTIYCALPGHESLGMSGTLTVTAP